MRRRGTVFVMALGMLAALASPGPTALAADSQAPSSAQDAAAQSAFNSAKELGTTDAWNAFLTNYPTGFYADLAHAYLKKAPGQPPAASPVPAVSTASSVPLELSCSERTKVRSVNSDAPTKITFVNVSGMYRSIQWIDFNGGIKDYGGLKAGERVTYDTFVTHPWMISTGPGDCLQIFLPASGAATVELSRLAADGPKTEPVERDREPSRSEKKEKRSSEDKPQKKNTLVCGKNYKLRKGECVLVQNCGSNAYRSPEGDCYCNKNYQMRNGTCVWKQDKNGYEISPEKKTGCKSWQAQCSRGNNKACGQYEANCQVN